MNRREFIKAIGYSIPITFSFFWNCSRQSHKNNRPNILFAISDDQSWLHTGASGDSEVKTPAFDRVAKEGVLFTHAFVAAPSCTPSRGAILTGQAMWQLKEGGLLFGTLPPEFVVFPRIVEQLGYYIGWVGAKAWGPGDYTKSGRKKDPAGPRFNKHKLPVVPEGFVSIDYFKNFLDFLENKPPDQPFCLWYGAGEPHRKYQKGIGKERGKDPTKVRLPACLPENPEIRNDIADYYVEIERFDSDLEKMLNHLEKIGELDNTLIFVTSDNGMPFPRCKATLYDMGTRVPFAARYPEKVKGGRIVDDIVSLTDVAPTILDVCGESIPGEMTGNSLLPILLSDKSARVDPQRNFVVTAFERHTPCRPNDVGYPMRCIRTHKYAYIRNYEPDRWPAGDPLQESLHQGIYGDIDNGPSKTFMLDNQHHPEFKDLFNLAFRKRPEEELYDMERDPFQLTNLAKEPEFSEIKERLKSQLEEYLVGTNDPRMKGENPWDGYLYYFKDYWKKQKEKQ